MSHPWRVEFHCHSRYSPDSLSSARGLIDAARDRGIDRLVITDHNTIRGALAAKALDPERIIVGEEILTQRGELLAAFVSEEVPAMLDPQEAIQRLRQQGAFISVSHPFDRARSGWGFKTWGYCAPGGCHRGLQCSLPAPFAQRTGGGFCPRTPPGGHGWLGCAYPGRTGAGDPVVATFRQRR